MKIYLIKALVQVISVVLIIITPCGAALGRRKAF
ncbi:MAG: IlvGEDA operon leader peptide [Sodalis sp. (in: enterobacteria)]